MTEMIDLRDGAMLPDAILTALVAWGASRGAWIDAMGSLTDITVQLSGPSGGEARTLPGEWMAVSLRGLARPSSLKLMVVLSRQGVLGPELIAGELLGATVKHLTLRLEALSGSAGVSLSEPPLIRTAADSRPALAKPSGPASGPSAMPQKLSRPAISQSDSVFPDAGDSVEHFAFGTCEVLKSDGDRLHLRQKDGRVKEIALTMLRVEALEGDGTAGRKFKLERKA